MTIADEFRLEGKLEGLKEGELKGLKRGKLEGQLEAANSMLEKGISPDLVLECTGITQMQLKKLQQNRH